MEQSKLNTGFKEELKKRLEGITKAYSSGGSLALWGQDTERAQQCADVLAKNLVNSGLLPQLLPNENQIPVISTSSNSGINERALQEKLGSRYQVIAGDIAEVERVKKSSATPLRLDASLLPFANNSVGVVFDYMGAAWYEALDDVLRKTDGVFVKELLKHYCQKLRDGGILVLDDDPEEDNTTGQLIDKVLSSNQIEGFEGPFLTGTPPFQLRIYKKAKQVSTK